jgi:formylglycine-generating enzyme required for sulfatase activity/serine/threonine protein kinase
MSMPDKVMTPCPSCGAKLAVPSTAAGKKIRCPKCQTVVAITAEMVTPPPDNMTSPAEVLKAVPRPEVSLSDENTFAGAKQKKYAPESLGDQATFGGGGGSADDNFTDDMEIVDLAGRYKVEGVLGKGGMGEVLLATDTRLNRKVAIKRMLGDAAKSRTAVSRFLIEAKSIAALNHPNIVQIYDYGRDKDGPFLILEYVDGNSLLDKCHNGALSLELAVDLTCQLCDGLGKAHESGIIHRDIKPANVLMTKQGIPKLTDFGLAKDEASDSGLSVAGAVLGTLDFMPPEQRKDVSLTDSRSDLWSLAATLYQMVTGKSPKVIRLNDLPASLQSVLGKALEDKPNDRYQSAAEFRNALRQVMDESRATLTDLAEGQCPSCGTKNEASRKFCRKCAVSLEVKCLSCSKGMPVWDEICGSCGTKQSPLISSRKEQLQQRQFQAEGFLQAGKFPEATQIAEELLNESDPRFQHVKKWSAEFTEGLRREQQQQQQRAGVLYKEAKTHQTAHDYSSAIHALEQIPASLRTPDISALLMQVQGQEERTKELNDEIRLRVERRELDGLIARVDELLQLVPDRVDLRDLRDTLEKRDQQRLAARSSASLEANRLMDARKYAECVAVLLSIKGSLRTPEIEALQKDAASKQSRLEKLQKTIDQSVKNNQLQGLLTKLDELLLLKSDATEGDKQLREQLVAREQKQKSQIKALLQKVHQLRKEVRFDEAMELMRRVPEELQNEAISTAIDDLQFFADQRSAAIAGLTQATNERQIKEALANADEYRGMLTSEIIADKAFESAMKECRQRLDDLGQAEEFSIRRRQRQKKLIIVGSVVSLLLLIAVVGFVVHRQQRLTAIADAQKRGDDALQAADSKASIEAYSEVVSLDDTVADAWAGLAIAKLQQTPPDVSSAFGDLEKSAALSPDGEKLQQARRLGHARRAIERANAGSISEALQDIADAEKLAASANEIAVAKSAIASAYLKRAEAAVAAKQPEAALKELQEARTNNPQSDQLPRVSQMIADAYLDRADSSLQQSAVEPALAAIEFARAIQADLPRILELQAAALVIRAQQALQAGDRDKASADFLAAKNLSSKAAGLGALAASLADGLVQRCEEAFSDASFQEATAALQTVEEIDGTSATLLALKERLGKVLVSAFDNAIQAKESDHAIELTKSFSALQVPADERLRLTTAVAAILFQECQNEIAAEELTSAIDAFSKLQKLPVSDVSMRKQANDTLLPGMQTLILAGLKSPDFAPAVNALKEVATLGQINEAFDGQVRDSVQTLQDSELSPIITDVLLQSRLSRGLIAYYKLDGNAEDVTTYSGEGIVNGAISTSDRHGKANAAYAFDGKYLTPGSKTIVLPACGPLGKSPRTFSVWAKTATRDTQVLFDYGGAVEGDATAPPGSAFQLTLSYGIYGITASTGHSAVTYQADYTDNQWHHFVWIVPDTERPTTADIQLFLDGTLVSVSSRKTHDVNSALAVKTTKTKIVVGDQFTGVLDDIRIYDRALTSEEVADLFNVEASADGSRGFAVPGIAVAPFSKAQAKALQKTWADYLGVPVESTNSIGMKLVLIPRGEFMMGSPAAEQGRNPDETQRKVTLTKSFQIGKYEVTQLQYEQVMGINPSEFKSVDNPVEQVSWDDAVAFCAKLSALPAEQKIGRVYRLPTEAEWEYSCRAGTTSAYSFGDDGNNLGDCAWFSENSTGKTHHVGRKQANSWGMYDTHGNVWEWCQDWYAIDSGGATSDPIGPVSGASRVFRGGGWYHTPSICRAARRSYEKVSHRSNHLGLRVVCDFSIQEHSGTVQVPPRGKAPFDTALARLHQKAWADHLGVPVESTNSIGMKLVVIPPGEFTTGSPESEAGRQPDEAQHRVTIADAFSLGVYEVTQSQYEQVMGSNPRHFKGANNPVEQVTWNDAVDFCTRLSSLPAERTAGRIYRLPTEAEWEYACRAGTTTVYSFGDDAKDLSKYAWFGDNSGKSIIDSASMYPTGNSADYAGYFAKLAANHCETHAVGEKLPNGWGLYDMHGNVFEWCSDVDGSLRVRRGGGWDYGAAHSRTALRGLGPPTSRGNDGGFRIVCDLPRSSAAVSEIDKTIPAFLSEGLVAYYPFNGDANDESGNGHHGAVIESKPVADRHGQDGKAYQLDGNKSHITFPENLFGPDAPEVTLSLWITVDKSSFPFAKPIKIFLKGPSNGELALGLMAGRIDFGSRFAPRGEFHAASAAFQTESPTCVTGVYRKGKSLQLFLDGSLAGEQSVPNQSLISEPTRKSVRSAIGVVLTDSNFAMFKGVVDDLRIYNRALSAAEVKDLYEYELQSPASTAQRLPQVVAPVDSIQVRTPQTAWAALVQAPVEYTNSVGMKFVILPPADGPAAAASAKPSAVKYMGLCEVTQAEFQRVTGRNPSEAKGGQLPVEMVTVEDAIVFCANLSDLPDEQKANCVYRLPSDQEWESAARADTTDPWFFGNSSVELKTFAWYKGNSSLQKTREVALKPCNPWGFFDVYGNVWEWTQEKNLRGGSCRSDAEQCVSTDQKYRAGDRRSDIGFRVLLEKKIQ